MCHHSGADNEVGYLNPTSIGQSVITPGFNDKHPQMVKKKMMVKKQLHASIVENERRVVVAYINRCMYEWRDRHCIITPTTLSKFHYLVTLCGIECWLQH